MLHHQRETIRKGNNRLLEGITLHNIGVAYLLSGKFEQAFPFFQESVLVKKATFGDDHPEVAVSIFKSLYINIQLIQHHQGITCGNRNLTIRKRKI